MIKTLSILGSTGSIGTQTLDVADMLGLKISALTAASNVDLLEKQIRKYKILLMTMNYLYGTLMKASMIALNHYG